MKRRYPVIDMKRTGQNIKEIMQRRGMTVKNVQEFLELGAPQSIYHWLDGRNMPTIDNLYALSELFRLPVDAILKGNREFDYRMPKDMMDRRVILYCEKFRQLRAG